MTKPAFFAREDAGLRVLWAWRAGLDTAAIAAIHGIGEPEVDRALPEELEAARRRRAASGPRRLSRLLVAWTAADVDRHEVARRFGYRDAPAASNAVRHHRMLLREIAGVAA